MGKKKRKKKRREKEKRREGKEGEREGKCESLSFHYLCCVKLVEQPQFSMRILNFSSETVGPLIARMNPPSHLSMVFSVLAFPMRVAILVVVRIPVKMRAALVLSV